MRSTAILSCLALILCAAVVQADVSGFGGTGTGWQVNNGANGVGFISGNDYTPTLGGSDANGMRALESSSAFFTTPQPFLNGFTASYVYQATDLEAAFGPDSPQGGEGTVFVLQNDPRGAAAIGGTGFGQGYGDGDPGGVGMTNSAGLILNIFAENLQGGEMFVTAASPNTPITNRFNMTAALVLNSGDPINVTLTYNATAHTVTELLQDHLAGTSYANTYTGINLGSILGGTTALVGFTGSTGEATAHQTISNFSFVATAPEPSSFILCGLGAVALLLAARHRRKAR